MEVIALDVGTSMIKAHRFDEDGRSLAHASEPAPPEGAGGVDPAAVWSVACRVLSGVTAGAGGLAGVIVTGQGDGLWRIDESGAPLASWQWNSTRGAGIVRRWEREGIIQEHYRASASVLWPGTAAALWAWLSETDPVEAARTGTFFTVKDWVGFQLCGRIATDVTDATIPFLDPLSGSYSSAAFARLGCADLESRAPQVLNPGDVLGEVRPDAAAATGLPVGLPVYVGCIDVGAMLLGLGVNSVGQSLAILGTTVAAIAILDRLPLGQEPSGAVVRLGPDRYFQIMATNSGTTTLDWFMNSHGYLGEDRYQRYWEDVAGADGELLMLPYLAGERAPFLEPAASGAYVGVTPHTTTADFAKATVEGISYALRLNLEAAGGGAGPVLLTGGGSQGARWRQLIADVTGRPVQVDPGRESSLLGAASLVPGFAQLAAEASEHEVYLPGEQSTRLQAGYARYTRTLLAFRQLWPQLSEDGDEY